MRSRHLVALAVACLSVGLIQRVGAAVTMPYTAFDQATSTLNDFTATTGGGTATADTWSINGSGALDHVFLSEGGGNSTTGQYLATSGIAGTSFTQKVNLSFSSIDTGVMRWENQLVVLSTSTSLPGGSTTDNWYAAVLTHDTIDWGNYPNHAPDRLTLYGCTVGGYSWDGPITLGEALLSSNTNLSDTYELSVSGSYDALNHLTLSASLKDLTTSTLLATATSSPIANPSTGSYFGLQEAGWSGSGGTTQYSNYSLTPVPEPTSIAILGLASLGLLNHRRRGA